MAERRATILGTGLIGTSLGLALREQGWQVAGWDPNNQALAMATERGAVTTALTAPGDGGADLVVLATPPEATKQLLAGLATDALVTDVAGVKIPVLESAREVPRFVGGHPMAGGATSGPDMASSQLFRGAAWVLTSDGAAAADLEAVAGVVSSIGAHPVVMSAETHDRAVARVSHLPHLIAAALVEIAADDDESMRLAGGGFRDLTRVAGADAGWWAELLMANASNLEGVLASLQDVLSSWRDQLASGSTDLVARRLDEARISRSAIGEHHVQVRVVLVDRPGELARVGHALEQSGVDVRDIQLRHSEHGGGGVLTLSVRPSGREMLTAALIGEGFRVDRP